MLNLAAAKDRLESWKTVADILQSVVTVAAIIIGGIWTYKNFVEQRQNHVRAQLSQNISELKLADHYNLLIVDEHLLNLGTRVVSFEQGRIRVYKVLPLPPAITAELHASGAIPETNSRAAQNKWQLLHKRDQVWDSTTHIVEPGEVEQIHNEFLLPSDVQVVMVLSYVYNPREQEHPMGWEAISLYDLRKHATISGQDAKLASVEEKSN